jgi:hypothetical protein
MKALSIRQPFASLIILNRKDREYRPYRLPLGRLAIHAAQDQASKDELWAWFAVRNQIPRPEDFQTFYEIACHMPRGVILGSVAVIAHELTTSPWGKIANVLQDPEEWHPYEPARGKPGIWQWQPARPHIIPLHHLHKPIVLEDL